MKTLEEQYETLNVDDGLELSILYTKQIIDKLSSILPGEFYYEVVRGRSYIFYSPIDDSAWPPRSVLNRASVTAMPPPPSPVIQFSSFDGVRVDYNIPYHIIHDKGVDGDIVDLFVSSLEDLLLSWDFNPNHQNQQVWNNRNSAKEQKELLFHKAVNEDDREAIIDIGMDYF